MTLHLWSNHLFSLRIDDFCRVVPEAAGQVGSATAVGGGADRLLQRLPLTVRSDRLPPWSKPTASSDWITRISRGSPRRNGRGDTLR
jgi:hypothetical protein